MGTELAVDDPAGTELYVSTLAGPIQRKAADA
jgi:hypothetical protein